MSIFRVHYSFLIESKFALNKQKQNTCYDQREREDDNPYNRTITEVWKKLH